MSDDVKVARDGQVVEITLDRPKANAIDQPTSRKLGDAFAAFRDDPELRVAIFTGGGEKFFSAGWDLNEAATTGGDGYIADYGQGGIYGFLRTARARKAGHLRSQWLCHWGWLRNFACSRFHRRGRSRAVLAAGDIARCLAGHRFFRFAETAAQGHRQRGVVWRPALRRCRLPALGSGQQGRATGGTDERRA